MDRSSTRTFWKNYFTATQHILPSWLAHLSAEQRVQMLAELMQWELTTRRSSDSDSVHRV